MIFFAEKQSQNGRGMTHAPTNTPLPISKNFFKFATSKLVLCAWFNQLVQVWYIFQRFPFVAYQSTAKRTRFLALTWGILSVSWSASLSSILSVWHLYHTDHIDHPLECCHFYNPDLCQYLVTLYFQTHSFLSNNTRRKATLHSC